MPEQPAQTIPPTTPLPDTEGINWLADLQIRAKTYGICVTLGFILAFIPMPFIPSGTLTLGLIQLVIAPAAGHFLYLIKPPDLLASYLYIGVLLSFVLPYPVLLSYELDLVTPLNLSSRSRRLVLTLFGNLLSFVIGIAIFYVVLLPLGIHVMMYWNPIGIELRWDINAYLQSMTTLMFVTGFAFQLPALMSGSVWLRITTGERLAQWRPYVVLAAFVVGALLTPSPDAINQAVVAVPICLLYELGLLLARLVPAPNTQPTV